MASGVASSPAALACVTGCEPLHTAKWLSLNQLTWTDPSGKTRQWESLSRTTRRPGADSDGADIIATIKKSGEEDRLVLVKQFRPPMRACTLEFPAGLMDPAENVETTAIRELYEETGYQGRVERVSKAVSMDPGASNCATTMVVIHIDGDDEVNVNPSKHLDEGEFIDVMCVPISGLLARLEELSASMTIDSRLYAFALGLSYR
ncbi:ADP-sugar pyrophosphatase-like [Sycon ciliatum]|uniref:ADP-sugar pyrophosphatase-like n=1 Tax=Sycon ciliatum TaxID=27933 RepID=UPI0031F6794F